MKRLLIILCCIISTTTAYSQFMQRSEFGMMLGGSNYIGDINPKYNFYGTNFMGGIIYRYNFDPRWVIKGSALFGQLAAYDKDFNNIRNLSFQSKINEVAATVEFNFFEYQTGSQQHRVTPYLFAGLGLFFINPKTEILNPETEKIEIVNLQPLCTEGQGMNGLGKPYSLTQISIPFGLGLKVSFGQYICLGLEWGLRKTFTDYMDDISTNYVDDVALANYKGDLAVACSDRTGEIVEGYLTTVGAQRGNPKTQDWYQFFGITLTTKLNFLQRNKCISF